MSGREGERAWPPSQDGWPDTNYFLFFAIKNAVDNFLTYYAQTSLFNFFGGKKIFEKYEVEERREIGGLSCCKSLRRRKLKNSFFLLKIQILWMKNSGALFTTVLFSS
jgi:hypothetical protein